MIFFGITGFSREIQKLFFSNTLFKLNFPKGPRGGYKGLRGLKFFTSTYCGPINRYVNLNVCHIGMGRVPRLAHLTWNDSKPNNELLLFSILRKVTYTDLQYFYVTVQTNFGSIFLLHPWTSKYTAFNYERTKYGTLIQLHAQDVKIVYFWIVYT